MKEKRKVLNNDLEDKTQRIVTIKEHTVIGGLGEAAHRRRWFA